MRMLIHGALDHLRVWISWQELVFHMKVTKETTLERADFTLQLLMFVTAEKGRRMFFFSFSPVYVSCCPRDFKH